MTYNKEDKILIIGAGGQIGIELVQELSKLYGSSNVIAADVKPIPALEVNPFEKLDVLDKDALLNVVKKHSISHIYLLAAMLSATGEQNPMFAWKLNMEGLFNVLDLAKEKHISRVFWPSSIAVFGTTSPIINTPQYAIMEPTTIYGISKQAGERWCEWYYHKFGVDVRSLRYPGLLGWKSAPGGGTTDYAVHIFHQAIKTKTYECFLGANTALPMMHMEDAIRATIEIMHAPSEQVKIRSSYNLAGISFTPEQIATEIKKHIPDFVISYKPDFRQQIADSWPKSIDDSSARKDWNWTNGFNLKDMVRDMISNLNAGK